jgi:hypothetical protein
MVVVEKEQNDTIANESARNEAAEGRPGGN